MFDLDVAGRQAFNPWKHSPSGKAYNLISAGSTVLDVGCSGGHMATELQKKKCIVHGIEIDPIAANRARNVCKSVVEGDMDDLKALPFSGSSFDYILTLDVLEHMRRPDRALALLQPLLKPEGFLICSIPNVARLEVRLALLFGKFEYGDGGALSKGHLRFFTRRSAAQLLHDAGFVVRKVEPTGLGSMIRIMTNVTAYQFMFICQQAKCSG